MIPRTSDVLLLGRSLLRVSSLLDVHDQLRLRLVLVDRPGRVVNLVAINVETSLPRPRATKPVAQRQYRRQRE